ncbi:hypothetical protein HPB50_024855 [Hyalomma asiaticum]|uniref:Uncharacterized protein n=3 Tax=Hyalomma asiaticum TaxID=266040 RepID=A0ACB7RQ60_HYAAI|nr:hypothetical protein HPB50_018995 [Hyalomma asiaticum]KAH6924593.1 hypothetical protein HPB50_019667 [Hyalomma asiaticum]KAH6924786.1 hypothetical protein HPB50_024855 [Hyalomma asiaticum]
MAGSRNQDDLAFNRFRRRRRWPVNNLAQRDPQALHVQEHEFEQHEKELGQRHGVRRSSRVSVVCYDARAASPQIAILRNRDSMRVVCYPLQSTLCVSSAAASDALFSVALAYAVFCERCAGRISNREAMPYADAGSLLAAAR